MSSPRRQGSRFLINLKIDSRLRGNDKEIAGMKKRVFVITKSQSRIWSYITKSMQKVDSKITWYITLIGFLGIFSTTISKNPVLPLFIKGLGGQDYILGIIAAASPFAGIVFSFPVGFIADQIGKRKLLIVSAIIFTVAPLLYLIVFNPLLLIPIRFFHGMATAIMGPVASAIIVGLFNKNKAEKLGVYSSATLFGRTIAPIVGGFIISIFAYAGGLINYKIVYLVAFIAALPILLLAILIPKENKNVAVTKVHLSDMILAFKQFILDKVLISTALVDMATYFIYGVLEAYLPIFLLTKHVKAELIGLLFSMQVISIALTKPFFGKLADRIDKRIQIMSGIIILTVTTTLMYYISSYILMVINILVFGLGMSLSTVATSTYIAEQTVKDKQATALGLLSALMDVGQTSGPFVTGFIVTIFSYKFGFYFASLTALISAIFFYFSTKSFVKKNSMDK
jgi:MFS family permease